MNHFQNTAYFVNCTHRNAHFARRGKGLDEAHNVRMTRGARCGNLAVDALWVRDQRAIKALDGDLRWVK